MTKLDATKLLHFDEKHHRPYTECTQELLDFIQEGTGRKLDFDRYIFTQKMFSSECTFYTDDLVVYGDVYYTNEQFKEWLGMTKSNKNTMPDLVAGKHLVKLESGRHVLIMGDFGAYVELGASFKDVKIYGWDMCKTFSKNIVEVYDINNGDSWELTNKESTLNRLSIWKKEDDKKQKIKEELELAKAKMERLQSHINVLESKV